jgi:hypothetical protein
LQLCKKGGIIYTTKKDKPPPDRKTAGKLKMTKATPGTLEAETEKSKKRKVKMV